MKHLSCLLAVAMATGFQVGCGDGNAGSNSLDAAAASLEQVRWGYVPTGSGEEPLRLTDHQVGSLEQVSGQLDAAIADGSPSAQVAARRLRAQIAITGARDAARRAAAEYARIAPRMIESMSLAFAADRAAARGVAANVNQPALIQSLRGQVESLGQQRAELGKQAEALQAQAEGFQRQLDQANERRRQAMTRVAELEQQAFVAEGQGQFDLQNQAAEAEREGTIASTEAARHQLHLDMVNAELAVINGRLDLAQRLVQETTGRVEAATQRQAAIETEINQSKESQDEAFRLLAEELSEVRSVLEQSVLAPLQEADQRSNVALEQLQAAQQVASGDARGEVQVDLLNAMTARAGMLVEQANVLRNYHDVLSLLHGVADRVQAPIAQEIGQQLQSVQQRRQEVQQSAGELVQAGVELAGQVENVGSDETQQLIQLNRQRLEAYDGELAAGG